MKTNYRLPFDILRIPIKLNISFLIFLLVIAFYIYAGVTSEFQNLVMDQALEGLSTGDLMTEEVISVGPFTRTSELKNLMIHKRHLGYPVVSGG